MSSKSKSEIDIEKQLIKEAKLRYPQGSILIIPPNTNIGTKTEEVVIDWDYIDSIRDYDVCGFEDIDNRGLYVHLSKNHGSRHRIYNTSNSTWVDRKTTIADEWESIKHIIYD